VSLQLRSARPDDLPVLLALLRQDALRTTPEPPDVTDRQRAALDDLLADPRADVLVGELDGRLVCTATVNYLRGLSYDGGLICQIEAVRTVGDLRGQGIGRALIASIVETARERGCARVQLTSNRRRDRAHAFYERLGFTPSHVGFKLEL
jgi:GNAT superfamily N-acetyltransferase